MGDSALVGSPTYGNRFGHFYGHFHQMLRHSHAILQSEVAKELAFYRNAQKAGQIATAEGKQMRFYF